MKVSALLLVLLAALPLLAACGDGEEPAATTPANEATERPTAGAAPTVAPTEAATAAPGPPGTARIAFMSDRDGNGEIYVMNADGAGLARLTNNLGQDINMDWSPDGTRIAFASNRDGNSEIYVISAD